MNRAFLIIVAPAVLVIAFYLGMGWGITGSLPIGVGLLVIAGVALLLRRRKRRPEIGS